MGTAPAHDRHDGFHNVTDKESGIKYLLNNQSGDWKQDKAYNIMTTALRNNEKIRRSPRARQATMRLWLDLLAWPTSRYRRY